MARFCVVIPFLRTRRGHGPLLATLASCLAQDHADFEILVVANLPDPELAKEIRALSSPNLSLYCVGRPGVNRARNLGGRNARADFLFFLDDDCILPRAGFLRELEAAFLRKPGLHALGGPYHSPDGLGWRGRAYNQMASAWAELGGGATNLLGGNICLRQELFGRGLFFSEDLVSGGDETEYLRRLRAGGFRTGYSRELGVIHRAEGSWKGLFSRAWRQGRAHGKRGVPTPVSFREKLGAIACAAADLKLLAFLLLHFSTLYLAAYTPKLAQRIKSVGDHEEQEYVGA